MVAKTFVILRRWGQRGKGDLSRFSAAELGMMRLGGWIWGRCRSGGVGSTVSLLVALGGVAF